MQDAESSQQQKRGRKPMRKKIIGVALGSMLLALSFPAHAQQPTKVPRIGFLLILSPSAGAARGEAFRQGVR